MSVQNYGVASYSQSVKSPALNNSARKKAVVQNPVLNKKVSFSEGLGLIATGFKDKAVSTVKSIITHPVQAIGVTAITTVGIAALPLIGISATTGTAVLAVGFGAFSAFNAGKDIIKAVNHNKSGQYDQLRQDLHAVGSDSLDVALSVPFVPKGVRQITKEVKYGSGIKLNRGLLNELKNAKDISAKVTEYIKGNVKLVFDRVVKEKGYKVAPELVFTDATQCAAINGSTGQFMFNPKYLIPNIKSLLTRPLRNSTENIVAHELKHFDQFSQIARTDGLGARIITRDANGQAFYDRVVKANGKLNGKVAADSAGNITANTAEAQQALHYYKAMSQYPTVPSNLKPIDKVLFKYKLLKFIDPAKHKFFEAYTSNVLEAEALKTGIDYANKTGRLSTGYALNNLQAQAALSAQNKAS